jgi:hypothetical protein
MKNMGEILLEKGIINPSQVKKARELGKDNIVESLVALGYINFDSLVQYIDYELKVNR